MQVEFLILFVVVLGVGFVIYQTAVVLDAMPAWYRQWVFPGATTAIVLTAAVVFIRAAGSGVVPFWVAWSRDMRFTSPEIIATMPFWIAFLLCGLLAMCSGFFFLVVLGFRLRRYDALRH